MKLLSGIPKKLLFATIAIMGLAPAALAQTRTIELHTESVSALGCLLEHRRQECSERFVGGARRSSQFWLWWNSSKELELGPPETVAYAGTQPPNAYTTKYLDGRTADIYDVKYRHHQFTFYIAKPGPDGKIRFMLIRSGGPDDEKRDLFARGPG
jgi:hypothetical protein